MFTPNLSDDIAEPKSNTVSARPKLRNYLYNCPWYAHNEEIEIKSDFKFPGHCLKKEWVKDYDRNSLYTGSLDHNTQNLCPQREGTFTAMVGTESGFSRGSDPDPGNLNPDP